jgi:hypothetical protein
VIFNVMKLGFDHLIDTIDVFLGKHCVSLGENLEPVGVLR